MKKHFLILLLFNGLQVCYGQIVVPKTPQVANLETQNKLFQNQTARQKQNVFEQNQGRKVARAEEQRAKMKYLQAELQAEEQKEKAAANDIKGRAIYAETLAKLETILQNAPKTKLKNAVFIVENAYYENSLSLQNFDNQIQQVLAEFSKYAKIRNLDLTIYEAKMQALAEFYRATFHYDFNDTRATNHQNYLVQKLLQTRTGQCHSMPLLFKILADELNLQTYLSFSPEHSFIKMKDSKGKIYNYEPTNGNFMGNEFVISSGFVTPKALATKTYNDTINSYQSLVYCVYDLALSYQNKYGTDDFVLQCAKMLDNYSTNKLFATTLKADYFGRKSMKAIKVAGYPPAKQVYTMPDIRPLLVERDKYYQQLDDLGVPEISVEQYETWLKSTKK